MKYNYLISMLVVTSMFVSCEINNVDPIQPEEQPEKIANYDLVQDLGGDQVNCNITINDLPPSATHMGDDAVYAHVINNFGTNIETPDCLVDINSVFELVYDSVLGLHLAIKPIIEYTKNELSSRKLMVSWNEEKVRQLTDSVYFSINEIDSSYHRGLFHGDCDENDSYSIIHFNILVINRYGCAKVNVNTPALNNHLRYYTNKFDATKEDSIDIAPTEFREKYGDAYCSSQMLGTFCLMGGKITMLDADSASQKMVLNEAIDKLKKHIKTGADWEELVKDSEHLQNSFCMFMSTETRSYNGALFGNYIDQVNCADSIYRLGEFMQYSQGFRPYSDIYPNYNFVDFNFPH